MPSEDLRSQVLELAKIAEECPEPLRLKCFELLLSDYLENRRKLSESKTDESTVDAASDRHEPDPSAATPPAAEGNEEIGNSDLHVKARRFLERYGVTMEQLNNFFYKESGQIRPLFEDLRTTRTAESQIRIALLQALQNGITSGEFQFDGERVREECQLRKCYDRGNFSANFKNNAQLFDGFDKYEKQASTIRLSDEGRKELAQVMKELQ